MGALLSQIQDKPAILPPRIVIHSAGGHGKTTMMASVPGIVAIPAEDGAGKLSYPAFPKPTSYADVMHAIRELHDEEHGYKAIGIDTIDHVEPLIWQSVCADRTEGKKAYESIEDFGYAKGYIYADTYWADLFHALDRLRADRKMTTIILAHNERKTIGDPQLGGIERTEPKIHKRAAALLHEWADVVGFLDVERIAIDVGDKSQRKVTTASSTGQRILHLEDRGSFRAKNRYDLPPMIEIPKNNPYQPLRDAIASALGLVTKKEA
jgi:hypothetical protein